MCSLPSIAYMIITSRSIVAFSQRCCTHSMNEPASSTKPSRISA